MGREDRTNRFSSFLVKRPQNNLLLIRQGELPASSPFYNIFDGSDSSFFDDVLWINPECNELNPNVEDTRDIYNY